MVMAHGLLLLKMISFLQSPTHLNISGSVREIL